MTGADEDFGIFLVFIGFAGCPRLGNENGQLGINTPVPSGDNAREKSMLKNPFIRERKKKIQF
jgi:hypothetical protein